MRYKNIIHLKQKKMKKLEVSEMAKIEGGKFWGRGETTCTPVDNGAGQILYYWCCYDYYVLWINTGTTCDAA